MKSAIKLSLFEHLYHIMMYRTEHTHTRNMLMQAYKARTEKEMFDIFSELYAQAFRNVLQQNHHTSASLEFIDIYSEISELAR